MLLARKTLARKDFIKNFMVLLKTSRPVGWIIGPLVFLIGIYVSGLRLASMPVSVFVQLALLSFPASLLVYGINDVYDYDTDRINPRKGSVEGGFLQKKYHKMILRISIAIAAMLLLSSVFAFNIGNLFAMMIFLFLTISYSARPLRLKEMPVIDSLSNGLMFLSCFAVGYSYNHSLLYIPVSLYFVALCVAGVHALGTVMDCKYDLISRQKTFSTVFGKRAAALFAFTMFALTLIFGMQTLVLNYYLTLCALLSLMVFFFPMENVAKFSFKMVFAGFIITVVIFLCVNFRIF